MNCKICKKGYFVGDLVCGKCHYYKVKEYSDQVWKLRQKVIELKIKLKERNKKRVSP